MKRTFPLPPRKKNMATRHSSRFLENINFDECVMFSLARRYLLPLFHSAINLLRTNYVFSSTSEQK